MRLERLAHAQIPYLESFDVTEPDCWKRLEKPCFDLVIFQFPLIPAFSDQREFKQNTLSVNTLNRALLRQFLDNALQYALDPDGPMLCYITSKDVKPYCEWDLEKSLTKGSTMQYLGQRPFDISQFQAIKLGTLTEISM